MRSTPIEIIRSSGRPCTTVGVAGSSATAESKGSSPDDRLSTVMRRGNLEPSLLQNVNAATRHTVSLPEPRPPVNSSRSRVLETFGGDDQQRPGARTKPDGSSVPETPMVKYVPRRRLRNRQTGWGVEEARAPALGEPPEDANPLFGRGECTFRPTPGRRPASVLARRPHLDRLRQWPTGCL